MKIENIKTVKIDELAGIVPRKSGATFSQLWQILYYTRLFKYVHKEQYIRMKTAYNKITTHKNLQKLCELEYFTNPQKDIYCATNKVLPILREAGFNIELLPSETEGEGGINQIHNTEVFIQALKLKIFETLLYPQFKDSTTGKPYLIPDALLVQRHKDKKMYKLTFLEIEAKKSDWENYINTKRSNYIRLSKDIQFYDYWSSVCPKLNLPVPDIADLHFSVCFIGNITKNFGYGFRFTSQLNNTA